jgi:hypothetical protein
MNDFILWLARLFGLATFSGVFLVWLYDVIERQVKGEGK